MLPIDRKPISSHTSRQPSACTGPLPATLREELRRLQDRELAIQNEPQEGGDQKQTERLHDLREQMSILEKGIASIEHA